MHLAAKSAVAEGEESHVQVSSDFLEFALKETLLQSRAGSPAYSFKKEEDAKMEQSENRLPD